MSEQLRSMRHERDVREHGDAVTTRPWWDAPGEESRMALPIASAAEGRRLSMSMVRRKEDLPIWDGKDKPTTSYILANPRHLT